jgi:hypothetical protein
MNKVKIFLKTFYNIIKSNPLYLLIAIAIFVRFRYTIELYISQGLFPKTNDSYWYVDHANELINSFKIDLDFNGIFYISYYSIVALLLLIFKSDVSVVYFQVFIGVLTVIPLFKTAETLINKRTAFIASLFFIFSKELNFWSTYILTDSIFISNLIFMIYSYTFLMKTKKKKYLHLTIANIIYMILLRPAGTITVCFLFIYIIIMNISKIFLFIKKNKLIFIISAIGIIPYIGLAIYYLLNSELGLSFFWNLRWLLFNNYGAGQIFDIPTVYDHKYIPVVNNQYMNNFVISFFINNFYHIIVIYAKRFIFLWGEMWIWSYHMYSISHALDYFRRCIPLILAFWGMLRVLLKKQSSESLVLFVPIISTIIFCVIFFLDSGWRYRLPSVPFNAIFVAYSLDYIISLIPDPRRLAGKFNKLRQGSSSLDV